MDFRPTFVAKVGGEETAKGPPGRSRSFRIGGDRGGKRLRSHQTRIKSVPYGVDTTRVEVVNFSVMAIEDLVNDPPTEDMLFPEGPKTLYQPRITFHVKHLHPDQRRELRTVLHVLRLIEMRVRAAGSIRKAAVEMGVSKSFLHAVLRGKKPPGYTLAKHVGYVPKVLYLREQGRIPWTEGTSE
jgi:hypothetical protein